MTINIAGYDVLIDKEDLDKIVDINWTVLKASDKIYFRKFCHTKKTILLHRHIINASKNTTVDHINGNTLDNRKCNLRLCTVAENSRNRRKNITNSSGYKGVSWASKRKKWQAKIMVNRKTIFLGYFNTAEDAYAVYCEASKKYHGEYRRIA